MPSSPFQINAPKPRSRPSRYTEERRDAVLTLWRSKKFSTYDIAHELMMREADVAAIIHIEREKNRSAA